MWGMEKGVRCGNSWRPDGESESRGESAGVHKQQSLMRVYTNSPLLRYEQYLLKQYCAAPPGCQVSLPGRNSAVALQSLTQKQEHVTGARGGGGGGDVHSHRCSEMVWAPAHVNKQIYTYVCTCMHGRGVTVHVFVPKNVWYWPFGSVHTCVTK